MPDRHRKQRHPGSGNRVAISLAVFAFNLFGDSLRDFLDPRFKV
jgi:ABC-type dipeptide/oligopeptide/nickel transport system permease subunit